MDKKNNPHSCCNMNKGFYGVTPIRLNLPYTGIKKRRYFNMKKYVDNSVYCAIKNLFDSKPNFNANLVESQLENSKENLDDLLTARYICSKYLYETLADAIPLDPDGYKPSQNEIIERELQNGRGADFLLAMQYGIQSLGKRISETKAKEKMKLYKVKKPRRGVIWFADDTVQMTMSSLFDDGEL